MAKGDPMMVFRGFRSSEEAPRGLFGILGKPKRDLFSIVGLVLPFLGIEELHVAALSQLFMNYCVPGPNIAKKYPPGPPRKQPPKAYLLAQIIQGLLKHLNYF